MFFFVVVFFLCSSMSSHTHTDRRTLLQRINYKIQLLLLSPVFAQSKCPAVEEWRVIPYIIRDKDVFLDAGDSAFSAV